MLNVVDVASRIYCILGDIFFPKKCVCCGKYGDYLCYGCVSEIVKIRTPICHYCGRISANGMVCKKCKKRESIYFHSLIVAADYHSLPVKKMIHNLKYSGLIDLSSYCGELVFESLNNVIKDNSYIVTSVPLYWKRERKRGFNQSKLIAQYVAKLLQFPYFDLIKKICDTKNQVGLNKSERVNNLISSFEICDINLVKGKNIVLIDDVVTTGSTLNECSKMLIKSGAKRVIVAVVAKNITF